jgi:hypothetical protein
MFENLRKIRELNVQINRLERKISELNDQLTSKDTTIAAREEIIAANHREGRKASFVFDFDAVPVFSIERVWRDNRAQTCIGFINQRAAETEKKHVEWNFDCDETVHEQLCLKWVEWKEWKKDG